MDQSINSRPLLQQSDSENEDFDDDYSANSPSSIDHTVIEAKPRQIEPTDKLNVIYMIFYLLGMTTLMPWNFFITAEDYWMFKFRNLTTNSTDNLTPIQAGFTSDLSVASAVPNTIFLILNAFLSHKIPLKLRMLVSMTIIFLLFIVTTAFVEVNTDNWQNNFFALTLMTVIFMNIASAILAGGLFGIAGQFPSEYITAVVSGQALGGIFAAIAEIISLTFGASPKTTAFVYFMIGNVVMIISIICYIIMSRTIFFKYYTFEKIAIMKSQSSELLAATGRAMAEPDFKGVLKKIWLYGLTEWLVFVVTLSIYPAVTVLVTSQYHGNGHLWNDVYFITVVNYLIFNSGDYLGRIVAGLLEWPTNRPILVATLSILRIGFIPFLLLCNAHPRHHLPVLIHSDIIYILLMCCFSFTNGYLANIALICAPKVVHDREKEMASSTMAAFLGVGLAFGSTFSLIFVNVI